MHRFREPNLSINPRLKSLIRRKGLRGHTKNIVLMTVSDPNVLRVL